MRPFKRLDDRLFNREVQLTGLKAGNSGHHLYVSVL